MKTIKVQWIIRQAVGLVCASLLACGLVFAQQTAPTEQAPEQLLSAEQLNTLVAPVALYPDALLSQVLVAATYPLEIVEVGQWLKRNSNLQGPQLVDAARQQKWDPSIQALVAFPDVIKRLNADIRWTTDLGNAFLSQQADVMNAVQRMRAQAMAAGKLKSNAQETVTTEKQGDRSVIEIQPANPEVVYVPYYDPAYIWGPPLYGYYPAWDYPYYGFGFGFGPGIYIGGFFGGLYWGGWGWGANWYHCSIYQNHYFFNHYGYGGHGSMAPLGLTILAIGRESTIRIVRSINATAESQRREEDRVFRGLARNPMRLGSTTRRPEPVWRTPAAGVILTSRVSLAKVRNAATALLQHIMETVDTERVLHTAEHRSVSRFQSSPSYGNSSAYRASPSYSSSYGGTRTVPSNRFSPSYGNSNGYRMSPSYSGGYGGNRSVPSYRSSPSYGSSNGYRYESVVQRNPHRTQLSLQPVIRRRRRIPVQPFF